MKLAKCFSIDASIGVSKPTGGNQRKPAISVEEKQLNEAIAKVRYKTWKVYAKKPFGGPEKVMKYLGRYTHKTAITHHRIQAMRYP